MTTYYGMYLYIWQTIKILSDGFSDFTPKSDFKTTAIILKTNINYLL